MVWRKNRLQIPIPKVLTSGDDEFPPVELALANPNGLLAIGGNLNPNRLITAYRSGIFPWYSDNQPILWWSPDPRAVLFFEKLHISRSLAAKLRKQDYDISFNQAFHDVIHHCAKLRKTSTGTWLTSAMINAYIKLQELGYAWSLEVWRQKQLIGGIYGVDVGNKIFCGESMFSLQPNASKIAFVHLVHYLKSHNYLLLDCQLTNPHLISLGVEDIPRSEFLQYLRP